jgi:hypothetical protein
VAAVPIASQTKKKVDDQVYIYTHTEGERGSHSFPINLGAASKKLGVRKTKKMIMKENILSVISGGPYTSRNITGEHSRPRHENYRPLSDLVPEMYAGVDILQGCGL